MHRLFVRIVRYVVEVGFFGTTTPPPPRTVGQSQPITPRTCVVKTPTTPPSKRRYVADVHSVVVKKISVELRDWNTVSKANVRKDLTKESYNQLTVASDDRTSLLYERHTLIN